VHTLVSSGERRFSSPTLPGATFEFREDEAGEVDALYLTLPQAVVVHAVRIEGPVPDPATLALIAGTYDFTPTVSATLSLRNGKLIYRATGDPDTGPRSPFCVRWERGRLNQVLLGPE
jgi:hypothetical protein